MACTITLFNYLEDTPDTDGSWILLSGGPVDLSVNGGATATYSNGNSIGATSSATIDVADATAGTYVFQYTVAGGGSCEATANVTVTVVDGVVAGEAVVNVSVCSDDAVAYNIFDFVKGGDGLGSGVTAVTETGTWSGTGLSTAGAGYSAGTAAVTDDTFTPADAPIGSHVFVYSVDNGDSTTPPGCDNCEFTSTVTFTVYATPDAGTAGAVTLCNAS